MEYKTVANWRGISTSLFIIIGFLLFFIALMVFTRGDSAENNLYKTILLADAKLSEATLLSDKALGYYSESSIAYEKQNYDKVESSCKLARTSFSQSSQEYLEVASELKKSDIEDPLIENYVERLGLLSEIDLNLYEACEHFESAARYYDVYYNTNVPYDDPSYDMGTGEIDAMNEKIREHDDNVRKHNVLLADFTIELEDRLS
jgi:hypothetical protein